MTWSDFYLFCFIVGFALSVLSFFAGAAHIHLPFKVHLPVHVGHHGGPGGLRMGGMRGGIKGGVRGVVHGDARGGTHISWFNASTAMVFLAWFGGIGYLLTRHAHLAAFAAFAISALAGFVGGGIVFKFMTKLMDVDAPLSTEDHRIEGAIGTLSMPIREHGTGEIIFSVGGVRRCAGARSDAGTRLEKGTEVVIERYERGIAYVKPWEEFTK